MNWRLLFDMEERTDNCMLNLLIWMKDIAPARLVQIIWWTNCERLTVALHSIKFPSPNWYDYILDANISGIELVHSVRVSQPSTSPTIHVWFNSNRLFSDYRKQKAHHWRFPFTVDKPINTPSSKPKSQTTSMTKKRVAQINHLVRCAHAADSTGSHRITSLWPLHCPEHSISVLIYKCRRKCDECMGARLAMELYVIILMIIIIIQWIRIVGEIHK